MTHLQRAVFKRHVEELAGRFFSRAVGTERHQAVGLHRKLAVDHLEVRRILRRLEFADKDEVTAVRNGHAAGSAFNRLEADAVVEDVGPRETLRVLAAHIERGIPCARRRRVRQRFACKHRIGRTEFLIGAVRTRLDLIREVDRETLRSLPVEGHFELMLMAGSVDINVVKLLKNIARNGSRINGVVKCDSTPAELDALFDGFKDVAHAGSHLDAFNVNEIVRRIGINVDRRVVDVVEHLVECRLKRAAQEVNSLLVLSELQVAAVEGRTFVDVVGVVGRDRADIRLNVHGSIRTCLAEVVGVARADTRDVERAALDREGRVRKAVVRSLERAGRLNVIDDAVGLQRTGDVDRAGVAEFVRAGCTALQRHRTVAANFAGIVERAREDRGAAVSKHTALLDRRSGTVGPVGRFAGIQDAADAVGIGASSGNGERAVVSVARIGFAAGNGLAALSSRRTRLRRHQHDAVSRRHGTVEVVAAFLDRHLISNKRAGIPEFCAVPDGGFVEVHRGQVLHGSDRIRIRHGLRARNFVREHKDLAREVSVADVRQETVHRDGAFAGNRMRVVDLAALAHDSVIEIDRARVGKRAVDLGVVGSFECAVVNQAPGNRHRVRFEERIVRETAAGNIEIAVQRRIARVRQRSARDVRIAGDIERGSLGIGHVAVGGNPVRNSQRAVVRDRTDSGNTVINRQRAVVRNDSIAGAFELARDRHLGVVRERSAGVENHRIGLVVAGHNTNLAGRACCGHACQRAAVVCRSFQTEAADRQRALRDVDRLAIRHGIRIAVSTLLADKNKFLAVGDADRVLGIVDAHEADGILDAGRADAHSTVFAFKFAVEVDNALEAGILQLIDLRNIEDGVLGSAFNLAVEDELS